MKRSFDFLYYCILVMFKAMKRKDENDEISASSFYSILLSTNTILLLLPLKFLIPSGALNVPVLKYSVGILLGSLFVAWYIFCKYYFLKTSYYLQILEKYDFNEKNGTNSNIAIGVIFSSLTPIAFISIATWISHINWHF